MRYFVIQIPKMPSSDFTAQTRPIQTGTECSLHNFDVRKHHMHFRLYFCLTDISFIHHKVKIKDGKSGDFGGQGSGPVRPIH